MELKNFLNKVERENPNEIEFLQSVKEVAQTIIPFIRENKKYNSSKILSRMVEAERIIMFRVPWVKDNGEVQVNRGYRIEMNSAIGPYKGGLRFHPSVSLSILKFLAFEQTFKNSLTGLPLGGGKGGSNFDPKMKSDNEIMRFCQSFMTELYRHTGHDTDIPAGDIGVGEKEIGFLFGQYKRIKNKFTGAITGKGIGWGGSLLRKEATGYGLIYFVKNALELKKDVIKGKTALVSGSGNVAQFAAEKLIDLGAKVLTMSDSKGYIYDPSGIDSEKLEYIKKIKNIDRKPISSFVERFPKSKFTKNANPWSEKADIALPCATQNELDEQDAKKLASNNCMCVAEGANMPCTPEAIDIFDSKGIIFCPGKASNAGGVAVSGLEMSQNSMRYFLTKEEIDKKLQEIMKNIHYICLNYGLDKKSNRVDYVKGANIGGFIKVANAMICQGIV